MLMNHILKMKLQRKGTWIDRLDNKTFKGPSKYSIEMTSSSAKNDQSRETQLKEEAGKRSFCCSFLSVRREKKVIWEEKRERKEKSILYESIS